MSLEFSAPAPKKSAFSITVLLKSERELVITVYAEKLTSEILAKIDAMYPDCYGLIF